MPNRRCRRRRAVGQMRSTRLWLVVAVPVLTSWLRRLIVCATVCRIMQPKQRIYTSVGPDILYLEEVAYRMSGKIG